MFQNHDETHTLICEIHVVLEFSLTRIEISVWLIQMVSINFGWPKFKFDLAHVKYGV